MLRPLVFSLVCAHAFMGVFMRVCLWVCLCARVYGCVYARAFMGVFMRVRLIVYSAFAYAYDLVTSGP